MSANEILDEICSQLAYVMGPIAPVVMREKIKSYTSDAKEFPMDKIAQLVESLSYEINDEKGRAEFQKRAIAQIKRFSLNAGV